MNRIQTWLIRLSTVALVLWLTSPALCLPPSVVDLRLVALSGKTAPGTGGQTFYGGVGGVLNSRGQVVYGGAIQGSSGVRPGIWLETSPGQSSLMALTKSAAPGVGTGKTFDPTIGGGLYANKNGDFAFGYGYKPYPVDDIHYTGVGAGIWSFTAGSSLRVVAADGLPLPTNSGGPILDNVGAYSFALNNAGQIYFNSYDGTIEHLWIDTPNQSPREVVNTQSAVPGVPGAKFESIYTLSITDSGRASFGSSLVSGVGGVTDNNRTGIWQESSPGNIQLVARGGTVAPETGGKIFDKYIVLAGPAATNSSGQIAFLSQFANEPSSRAIFAQDAAFTLHKVVRDGDPAFGVPGATFVNFFQPHMNDLGQIAFLGMDSQLTVPTNGGPTGIWSNVSGSYQPVLRLGQTLPDIPVGNVVSYFNGVVLNNRGQLMIGVDYGVPLGGGNYSYTGSGLWAQDTSGAFHTILRLGDLVDVDPGVAVDLRTIKTFEANFYSTEPHDNYIFNDMGQIAVTTEFTDSSIGLFVSNVVAVPEPATACYLMAVGFALWSTQFRRRNDLKGIWVRSRNS